MKIAVVGAGLSGLTAAYLLRDRHDVVVYESAERCGGKIHTQHVGECTFDWGPGGFLSSARELLDLIHRVGLESELTPADAVASKRSIYFNGRLHALPAKPQAALGMSLLSPFGKLRALRELFAKPETHTPGDESVAAFFTRHFGREVADRIVAPALLGISASDARETSLDALFPRLRAMERESGSILRAMAKASRRARTVMYAFGGRGMGRLTDALASSLGERVRVGESVTALTQEADGSWNVTSQGATQRADAVVLAVPAPVCARLLATSRPALAREFDAIAYVPMRVAAVAFDKHAVGEPLDGFGFLAPRGQGVRILGALYASSMFPSQAPADAALVRVFVGGAADRQILDVDSEAFRHIVLSDVQTTLRTKGEPRLFAEVSWPHAIPQYALDHPQRVARIDAALAGEKSLAVTGNILHGIGVGDCVRDAFSVVQRF